MQPSAYTNLATEILDTTRAEQHGDYAEGFTRAAQIWSAILGANVTPHQVALCMAGIKIARSTMNPSHNDNFIDLAGYAGIAGALANSERSNNE